MIPLEDNFADVIGKAQRGLHLSDTELAEKARVSSQKIRKLRNGEYDELTLMRVAPVLGLAVRPLGDLATGNWVPATPEKMDGLAQFNTRYHDMTVNSYLVWDPATRQAIAVDTGADCSEVLELATKKNLAVKLILLTHTHSDHMADLQKLQEKTGAQAHAPAREPLPGTEPIQEGGHFDLDNLDVEARLTWGHSPGGMTFVITGLARPVAIVGDSLFAGSMGGGNVSYDDAVRNNLEKILTLPDETVICPGHGPMTTVREEKAHNPFFAGRI
jgi:hydroxyacylglutathione hydrolase